MDVLAGGEIHHRIAAPADRPRHLVDFFADRRGHRRVADIRIHLHEEVAADDHRLAFRVVDVVRDDRAAACDFFAHEFRRDFRQAIRTECTCAECLARVLTPHHRSELFAVRAARLQRLQIRSALLVFADRDVLHLRRDDAFTRVVHLRNIGTGLGAARRAVQALEAQFGRSRIGGAFAAVVAGQAAQSFGVVAFFDPALAQCWQTGADVNLRFGIGVGARRIVDKHGRILLAAEAVRSVRLGNFAHWHADIGARASNVDLAGIRQRGDSGRIDVSVGGKEFRIGVHADLHAKQYGAAKQETRRKLSEFARG